MKSIDHTLVQIPPNRQRKEFKQDRILSLAQSIEKNGLLQLPVLRQDSFLVSGERRLKAVQYLYMMGKTIRHDGKAVPPGHLPYSDLGSLCEVDAWEAELEENTQRDDLTWGEKATAILQLHTLRAAQKEDLTTNIATGEITEPTIQTHIDTAEEVYGRSDGYFGDLARKSIIVARHLSDPDVAKAKNLQDAFKVLKQKETTANHKARGEALPGEVLKGQHSLFLSPFQDLTLEQRYDIILTDPPYGMGAGSFSADGTGKVTLSHDYDDSVESWQLLMVDFARWSWQVTRPEAHLYAFCDIDRFPDLRTYLETAGWWVHRTPLIFAKDGSSSSRVPWPEHGPRRSYELVLYAVKGKKPVNHIAMDVFTAQHDPNLGHAAQKPVGAYVELLKRSARPGDQVIDPFCGSGPIFPACQEAKCIATGIEVNPTYYSIAADRLGGLV